MREGTPLYGKGYWAATDIDLVDWKTGKGNLAHGLDFIATAIEIDVDKETGKVTLIKGVHGDDAGQPINPAPAGRAGQLAAVPIWLVTHSLKNHSMMKKDAPLITRGGTTNNPRVWMCRNTIVEHVHTHDPYGPFGAKGAGEASSCSTMAAIANGVYDAVGVRIKDLPITPEKILKALKGKGGKMMFIKRLPKFEYHAPTSLSEALDLLAKYGEKAKVFAGGTDLLVSMKKREIVPEHLINLKGIADLKGIHHDEKEGIRIGALVTLGEIEHSKIVKEKFCVLWDAVNVMASPQIRTFGNDWRKSLQCCAIGGYCSSIDCVGCIGKNGGDPWRKKCVG